MEAGNLIAYVDDLWAIGNSWEASWTIARQAALILQLLGIQDAPQKRRLTDGPWEGGVYKSEHGKITKTVTEVKLEKEKRLLDELLTEKGIDQYSY